MVSTATDGSCERRERGQLLQPVLAREDEPLREEGIVPAADRAVGADRAGGEAGAGDGPGAVDAEPPPAERREGARIGRGDGADEARDRLGRLGPVDAAVLRGAARPERAAVDVEGAARQAA